MMRTTVKRLLAIVLIACCTIGPLFGQSSANQSVKELQEQLRGRKHDTVTVRLLFRLGEHYARKVRMYNTETHFRDSAISFLKDVVRLSDSLHFDTYTNKSRVWLGRVYLTDGDVAEGQKWFGQVIEYEHRRNHNEKEADLWALMAGSMQRGEKNQIEIESSYNHALDIYRTLKLWAKEADVQIQLADRALDVGSFSTCEQLLLSALQVYRKHKHRKLFNVYYLLSVCHRSSGDLSTSLSYVIQCLDNMEALHDTASAAFFYGELAYVYEGLGRVEESVHWYRKALRKREMAGVSTIEIYNTAGFLIQQLIKLRKEKESFALITRLKAHYPASLSMERAMLAQNLGRCYDALGKFDMAEQQFLEMIAYYSKPALAPEYMAIAQMDIGSFYVRRKKYAMARPYLIHALQLPAGTNISIWKRDIHRMLFKVDSAQGNYVSAIAHLQEHNQLNDSIFNASKIREIERLQVQFKMAQKEKEIITLNSVNKTQQHNLEQAAIIRNFIFLGVLAVLGFMYYRYKLKQNSNRQLERQQQEINKKNQNLEHLVKEREWLLKEIHHRVKNNFQMVMSLLGTQTHYIKSKETLQSLEESQQRIYAMSLIHQRLYQSGNFSAINMKEYIHELVDYLRNSFAIRKHIVFEIQVETIELNIAHALPIGLILNEAITNAMKYAFEGHESGRIEIYLRHLSEEIVELVIRDTGIGLPPHLHVEHSGTMGLNLMRGLSEEIEGEISITTNNGTTIRLVFNCELNVSLMPYSISVL